MEDTKVESDSASMIRFVKDGAAPRSHDESIRSGGGWNPSVLKVSLKGMTDQVIHALVEMINGGHAFHCSFIYATNNYLERRDLWAELGRFKSGIGDTSWMLLGDFNVTLSSDDSLGGLSTITRGMMEFRNCMEELEIEDVNSRGIFFTWIGKPHEDNGVLKKLDRVMGNSSLLANFPSCEYNIPPSWY
ncbi:hypothetical protein Pint_05274 [Pistacia integerrima]|uniref:Uncharacterized protein n=1 Tax=Pistacia integerrima TaxID=434235 RepID=A0ACC0Z1R1_9ROSI|nr:hypothetical protein Pint_05274 [Pistacia integerrima]